ncbi:hypothetical protein NQL31_001058 [Lotmaria passim]
MDEEPVLKLNTAEMRRQWRRYRQREYQYRLIARVVIRSAIWLLSVYLVRQWSLHAVPFYLVLSLVVGALVVVAFGGDADVEVADPATVRRGRRAHAATTRDTTEVSNNVNDHVNGEEAGEEAVDGGQGEDIHLLNTPQDPQPRTMRRRGEKAKSERLQKNVAATGADVAGVAAAAAEVQQPCFDGTLTAQQQRALLLAMQTMGTPGATRCAVDAGFRRRLVNTQVEDMATCVCGSGAIFGACCAPVKDRLLAIIEGEQ